MKKGDIVRRSVTYEKGFVLCRNFKDTAQARVFVTQDVRKLHPQLVVAVVEIVEDVLNKDAFCVQLMNREVVNEEATINWIVEKDIAVTFPNGDIQVFYNDDSWKLHREVAPSFQSAIANMSDEELQHSIEECRVARSTLRMRKTKVVKEPKLGKVANEALKSLSKLSPEKMAELKKKLGL